MSMTTTDASVEFRLRSLEAGALTTSSDLADIKATQVDHTRRMEKQGLALADMNARLGEMERTADARHTSMTAMLQEILNRLPASAS